MGFSSVPSNCETFHSVHLWNKQSISFSLRAFSHWFCDHTIYSCDNCGIFLAYLFAQWALEYKKTSLLSNCWINLTLLCCHLAFLLTIDQRSLLRRNTRSPWHKCSSGVWFEYFRLFIDRMSLLFFAASFFCFVLASASGDFFTCDPDAPCGCSQEDSRVLVPAPVDDSAICKARRWGLRVPTPPPPLNESQKSSFEISTWGNRTKCPLHFENSADQNEHILQKLSNFY
jgi:hypothetical protein